MTAQEKAKELIEKFKPFVRDYEEVGHGHVEQTEDEMLINAKRCAIICVNEIILSLWQIDDLGTEGKFWGEVKSELEQNH